jgi:hypothetical protein
MAAPATPGQEGKAVQRGTRGRLTFGIYPGSAVGDAGPAGPPDCQFGLMTDDCTPKPAFGVCRDVIAAHRAGRPRAC